MLALVPCAALPAQAPLTMGHGPHGYDFLIGTWNCRNDSPSAVGGPAQITFSYKRNASGNGGLSVVASAQNFDIAGYLAYVGKTKTWYAPIAYADGSYTNESATASGNRVRWEGPYFDASTGKTTQVSDTFTLPSLKKYTDLGQTKMNGMWKKTYMMVCTKR